MTYEHLFIRNTGFNSLPVFIRITMVYMLKITLLEIYGIDKVPALIVNFLVISD